MEIVYKKVENLIPYINNSRIHSEEQIDQICASINEFGFTNPLLIDEKDNIIAGHGRLLASKKLKMEEVPCIILSGLTEAQKKAYVIADNKMALNAGWDEELLKLELENLKELDFDLNLTGFNIDELDKLFPKEDIENEKENERIRTINNYNLDLFNDNLIDGKYEMPIIQNDNFIPKKIIGFNYAKTAKEKNVGVHFYLDDYQFERIWNNPDEYLETLSQYDCILSPDFSLYLDMPFSMKIWNIYRSRLIGQYYQMCGLNVIPTISWAEKETFEFCFDGIPKGSIVSISTIGVKRSEEAFKIWKNGVDEMIKRIEPSTILIYGGKVDYNYGNIEVIYYENEVIERMKNKK